MENRELKVVLVPPLVYPEHEGNLKCKSCFLVYVCLKGFKPLVVVKNIQFILSEEMQTPNYYNFALIIGRKIHWPWFIEDWLWLCSTVSASSFYVSHFDVLPIIEEEIN